MSKAFAYRAYGGPENQEFLERPVPAPGPGQLLIAVRAAGVNPVDWKIRNGWLGTATPPPRVLGVEAAGVVRQTGAGVEGFAVGDEVFGVAAAGGYAEDTLLDAGATARKPAGVTFVQAAALSVAPATAYDAVQQLDLEAGRTLLILGVAGGVGSAAAQIARARGLHVVGTAADRNREYVEGLGAVQVRYGEGVADRIRAAAPDGVDGLLDLIGGEDLREAAAVLADRTRLVSTADPDTAAALGGSAVRRAPGAATLGELARLVATGALDPRVTGTYPLDRAPEALAEVETGHARGKLVLVVE